ncbi:MAG TPA: hypothetical protein VGQ55_03905, partial [Pyrinomonadaceae bacterium]|nr:hypothetical protein [Pyrinomonadaceae bacterium]
VYGLRDGDEYEAPDRRIDSSTFRSVNELLVRVWRVFVVHRTCVSDHRFGLWWVAVEQPSEKRTEAEKIE